jgi:hypothetical protein
MVFGLASGFGCGDDEPRQPHDAGSGNAAQDAALDARVDASGPVDSGAVDGSRPNQFDASFFDASFIDDIRNGCLSSVAAACDGPEDCSQGICCAQIDPLRLGYREISCRDSCELDEGGFALCHPRAPEDFTCSADKSLTCRRSLLLPHDFIGVCAPESPIVPATLRGESVSGQIECGESRCDVGTEKCCLTVTFDIEEEQRLARSAHCLPIDDECNCESRGEPPVDAGRDAAPPIDAMPIDDDAGA